MRVDARISYKTTAKAKTSDLAVMDLRPFQVLLKVKRVKRVKKVKKLGRLTCCECTLVLHKGESSPQQEQGPLNCQS